MCTCVLSLIHSWCPWNDKSPNHIKFLQLNVSLRYITQKICAIMLVIFHKKPTADHFAPVTHLHSLSCNFDEIYTNFPNVNTFRHLNVDCRHCMQYTCKIYSKHKMKCTNLKVLNAWHSMPMDMHWPYSVPAGYAWREKAISCALLRHNLPVDKKHTHPQTEYCNPCCACTGR